MKTSDTSNRQTAPILSPVYFRIESNHILLSLVDLHNWPTLQILGFQFEVSESTANYIFHYWLGILRDLLPASLVEQLKK